MLRINEFLIKVCYDINGDIMEKQQREIFADTLRFFAIIFVIIIHATCNYYVESYGTKMFIMTLGISSLTSCAVPLFYMLSGCFLINKKNTNYKTFYKKVLKIILQTLFWTLIYLLIFKFLMNQDINIIKKMFTALFKEQVDHLWYMYPLIGLYILTPFISRLYLSLNEREKKGLLMLILVLPVLLGTLQLKFWDVISIPKFAIFFPELGLFVLGKYLYDNKKIFQNSKISLISAGTTILGLILIAVLAKIMINSQGISNTKPYFDCTLLPNFMLDTSLFIFAISINKYLEKIPQKIKKFISIVATNTGGIYFIHMIFLYLLPDINIFGLHFTANNGNLINMLLGSGLYFALTLIVVLIIKKIPYLNKTI